jgi:crotonobetainyl-CoA:carnitine CoA-transferase CaiB-like acyl-CoA transferase
VQPLQGITVVAVEQAVAAPIGTRRLGHLGRRVIKVGDRLAVGPVLGLLPPPESADWDWRLDPIPALGQHTESVLRELGFDASDLAAPRSAGVICDRADGDIDRR